MAESTTSSRSFAVVVPLLVSAVLAVLLWPELQVARWDLNDNVFHRLLVERVVEAAEGGESPLDLWVSEICLGYPVLRSYQPLGHWLTAA